MRLNKTVSLKKQNQNPRNQISSLKYLWLGDVYKLKKSNKITTLNNAQKGLVNILFNVL